MKQKTPSVKMTALWFILFEAMFWRAGIYLWDSAEALMSGNWYWFIFKWPFTLKTLFFAIISWFCFYKFVEGITGLVKIYKQKQISGD